MARPMTEAMEALFARRQPKTCTEHVVDAWNKLQKGAHSDEQKLAASNVTLATSIAVATDAMLAIERTRVDSGAAAMHCEPGDPNQPITYAELYAFLTEQRSEQGEHSERTARRMMERFKGRRFA